MFEEETAAVAAARRKARGIAEFYRHLVVFALVNAGLFVYNLVTTPGELWFFYPLVGWGIGLAAHGFQAFGPVLWGEAWQEAKARELLEGRGRR